MFLTAASESAQEARASRAKPRMRTPAGVPNGVFLPVAAFFLAMAVGWLVFSGTAARLLQPAGVGELRDLRKISASGAPARSELCTPRADAECVADGDTLRHDGTVVRVPDAIQP